MELVNGEYCFGKSIKVSEIAKKYGTPLYIYEADSIKSQYEKLINSFSDIDLKIHYACKALTNLNILKYIRNFGCGIDTVSLPEIQLALQVGFEPNEIIFTPNSTSIIEYQQAKEYGVLINIDSLSILEQFGQLFPNYPICIRFNPHIMAGGNTKISTGHIDSKFGISVYQLPHVIKIVKSNNMNINGLHMHTGSDILDSNVFLQASDILFNIAKNFENLDFIDFGSGFKVAYKDNDIETNIRDLGKKMSKKFNEFCKEYGKKLQLKFEPGKYLVSKSGTFIITCNIVKQTTSTVFVGVDSGQNHLIRPMFYDSYHEIINISNPKAKKRIYSIVGNICETDTFGSDRYMNEVKEGDLIAIKNAGAYGFMMSSNYNSRYRPPEVLIINDIDYLIRKRESFEDLIRNQIIINELFNDN